MSLFKWDYTDVLGFTMTVNDDCTGFLDFTSNISVPPHEAHGDFVIVNNGQEFFLLDNEEGWAASGVAKRIN